jgi:small subunit ribosomal protein S4
MRRIYRVMEKQFRHYYEEAVRRRGVTGEILLEILETRLDNVVYRLGFAASRSEARQIVVHRHISVNGRKSNIPSIILRPGDVVAVIAESKQIAPIARVKPSLASRGIPPWLELDAEQLKATVLRAPTREEIDTDVQEALIVEYYSR